MVSLPVVSYLIFKLCYVIPSANHPGSWLLLRKCLSLAPLFHSDLVEFALLYLTNECQLFNECKDLFPEPFRLILWQQRIELLLSHRQIAHLLFLILQFLVLRLHSSLHTSWISYLEFNLSEMLLVDLLFLLSRLLGRNLYLFIFYIGLRGTWVTSNDKGFTLWHLGV